MTSGHNDINYKVCKNPNQFSLCVKSSTSHHTTGNNCTVKVLTHLFRVKAHGSHFLSGPGQRKLVQMFILKYWMQWMIHKPGTLYQF